MATKIHIFINVPKFNVSLKQREISLGISLEYYLQQLRSEIRIIQQKYKINLNIYFLCHEQKGGDMPRFIFFIGMQASTQYRHNQKCTLERTRPVHTEE